MANKKPVEERKVNLCLRVSLVDKRLLYTYGDGCISHGLRMIIKDNRKKIRKVLMEKQMLYKESEIEHG